MARARTRVQVKFSDTDATGTVYHGNFIYYFEIGRLEVIRRIVPHHAASDGRFDPLNFVIAHIEVDYRNPVQFPDVLEVDSWVRHIGRTSVSFGFRLRRLRDGLLMAEGHDVIVFVDREGKSVPLLPAMRAGLETYLDPGPGDAEPIPVAVGTGNAGKVQAVQAALSRVGMDTVVEAVAVDLEHHQPMGDEAIRHGAELRARQALAGLAKRSGTSDPRTGAGATGGRPTGERLAVGLESGLVVMGDDVYVTGWCVVLNNQGTKGEARSAQILLPSQIGRRVLAGENLAAVVESVGGPQQAGSPAGAMGFLTGGAYGRREAWEGAVAFALAPFLKPELYAAT